MTECGAKYSGMIMITVWNTNRRRDCICSLYLHPVLAPRCRSTCCITSHSYCKLMRNIAVWHLGSGAACSYPDEMQLMVPLKNSLISVIVIFHNQFAIMVIIFKWSPLGSFKNNNLIIIMGHSKKYWAHNTIYFTVYYFWNCAIWWSSLLIIQSEYQLILMDQKNRQISH